MEQRELKALLKEAAKEAVATPDLFIRRNGILQQLYIAVPEGEMNTMGFITILGDLWSTIMKNQPELLPTFFPVFALICCDRKKGEEAGLPTEVDWSFME